MEDRQPVIVYLPGKVKKRLEREARRDATSVSALCRSIIMRDVNERAETKHRVDRS